MKKTFALLLLILTINFTQKAYCQINPDSVKITIQELKPGLSLISLYGGNLLLSSGSDGLFLVDASYADLAEKLKSEIQKIDSRPIKYLAITHWHFDHVGANALFGKDATIIAHEYTSNLLTHDQKLFGNKIPALSKEGWPDITFTTDMNIYFNSDTIQLIALPGGHSGGDIMVYFKKAKVLHVGDMIFADMFPFCDVSNGGNVPKMAEVIQKIMTMFPQDITIIPGHGRPYTMKDLPEYKKMIVSTSNIVKAEIKKGKSLEAIQKSDVLKDWKKYAIALSCNDWIGLIYKSIKK
jgi:cyclase